MDFPQIPGLLGGFTGMDPQKQGLLAAAFQGLQASGPSRMPVSLGQTIGQAGAAGMEAMRQGTQDQMKAQAFAQQQQLQNLQLAEHMQKLKQQQQTEKYLNDFAATLPTDKQAMFRANPSAFIQEMNKKYVVGGNLVGGTGNSVFTAPEKPTFQQVPVAGKPGVTQGMWIKPGETTGPAVGGEKVPEIMNPDVFNAKVRLAQESRPSVKVDVTNSGPKAFETELGKLDAKQLDEYRNGAQSGHQTLEIVGNLRGAIKQGVYSGGGANAKTTAANFVNGLTGVTPSNLPGSQLFNAEASKLVLEKIKTLGANPSNADREFIEKTVPMLATSPQARDALIGFMESKANDAISLYQRADAHARANHGFAGFDINPRAPMLGTVKDGYKFKGGNPADPANWEPVKK